MDGDGNDVLELIIDGFQPLPDSLLPVHVDLPHGIPRVALGANPKVRNARRRMKPRQKIKQAIDLVVGEVCDFDPRMLNWVAGSDERRP